MACNDAAHPTYVVLAAGNSTRMGFDKAIAQWNGRPLLMATIAALERRSFVLVLPTRLIEPVAALLPSAEIVVNDRPERGMAHSLHLALDRIATQCAVGVLLADMPWIAPAVLAATEAALAGADVAFPVRADGTPGHPVLFAPSARAVLEALPDGDTLRLARDDPSLRRATWVCADAAAFADVDLPSQWPGP